MSDHAMDGIRDANPIPDELAPLPIDEVWRRVEADAPQLRLGHELRPRSRRAWRPDISAVSVAISAAVAVGVVVLAILVVGHHRSSVPKTSPTSTATSTTASGHGTLPMGVAVGPPRATNSGDPGTAIPMTVKLAVQTRDPHGGLPWAMRIFQTTAGQTCVQIGRLEDGTIGVIGQDGGFANDHRFHPIPVNAPQADKCVETDGNHHAFENIMLASVTASADTGGEGLSFAGCGISGSHGNPCRESDLRVLQYGLLGPDASTITYLGPQGQHLTEPTAGTDGAYLIVESATKPVCRATGVGSGCGHQAPGASSGGPPLIAGLVTAVTYRDGHVCRVPPAPPTGTPAGAPQGSCPIVGYQPPRAAHLTANELAAPVTARKLPHQLVVDIAFTARVAVTNANSYYQYTIDGGSSSASTCSDQAGDDTGHADIEAGQRVVLRDHVKPNCSGVLHGTVSYIPNVGAGGSEYPTGFRPYHVSTITVGHFSVTLP